ncbi:kinase-like domain-containing protein [Gigaspora rosea]|uniref:Kinase-like domain-containing protein n=1 Tax=Gigaspora rosea TaxID=44941 RepID=A0A397UBU1_9GLOM|nr:kinase-like domain-containing protein [Gigaspora rosea]
MLSSLVQYPDQYLKINNNNSVIDNLKSNEINDKKDCINESENITEKNLVSPIQNVNLQTSSNTTSNSKNTTTKNYDYIHYCHKCGGQKLHDEWCEKCDREIFKSNFPSWTSENEVIDNFIRETQLSATTKFNFLEWIPFSSLTDIEPIGKGGFGEVFSAKWIDGPRTKWNVEKEVWERYSNVNVALKSLIELKEKDFTSELFKELKSHLKSNDQVVGRFNILRTYGMTRDPTSKAYMIVMTLADDGDLSAYMKKHFSALTFVKRLDMLYDMATGLCQIHGSGLMHRDLHSGNVMCQRLKGRDPGRAEEYRFVIGDLGQATPPKKDNGNQVFGVLPYIAPEVLCGKPYTQAADVYSFGILMWEILTGLKAFCDVMHDPSLMVNIVLSEARPDIPMSTPKLYADLMKRCWNGNAEERPDAHEIYSTIGTWLNQCLYAPNSKIALEFKRGDELLKTPLLQTLNPNNFLYSTYHDTKALRMKLEELNEKTSAVIDNKNSSNFEIPDSIENSLAFEIPDSIYNEDSSAFKSLIP